MRALALALLFLALPARLPAHAQDLQQVYRDAKGYDAQFAAARHALKAGLEKLPQGRALILPTLDLTSNATSTRIETEPHNSAVAPVTLRDAKLSHTARQTGMLQSMPRLSASTGPRAIFASAIFLAVSPAAPVSSPAIAISATINSAPSVFLTPASSISRATSAGL